MAEVEDRTSKGSQKRASVPLLAIENTPTETKKRKEDEGNEKNSENYKVEEQDQKLEEKKEKEAEKPAEDKPAIAVNADLEKALEARDKSKNEKIGGDASSTKDPKSEGMKNRRPRWRSQHLHKPISRGLLLVATLAQKGQFLLRSCAKRWSLMDVRSVATWLAVQQAAGCKEDIIDDFRFSAEVKKFTSVCYLVRSSLCFYEQLHEPLL